MAGSPQYATLVAATVTTMTFDKDWDRVEILNLDGAAAVYVTLDGSTPVADTTGVHVLPAAISSLELEPPTNTNTVVKLISSGTPKVSVRGV